MGTEKRSLLLYYLDQRFPIFILFMFCSAIAIRLVSYRLSFQNPLFFTDMLFITCSLLLFLLILRFIDDIRDHKYDSTFHQDRPVASGVVPIKMVMIWAGVAITLFVLLSLIKPFLLVFVPILAFYVFLMSKRFYFTSSRHRNSLEMVVLDNFVFVILSLYSLSYVNNSLWMPHTINDFLLLILIQISVLIIEIGRKIPKRYTVKGDETDDTYTYKWGLKSTVTIINISIALASIPLYFLHSSFFWLPVGVSLLLELLFLKKETVYLRFTNTLNFLSTLILLLLI